jgi:hypothetical protein
MTKLLLILMVMGLWSGCGGESPTGPKGQALKVETEKWDNGNIKVEFQYYRVGGQTRVV